FFFSSRRRHTRSDRDWSSDVCSSDLKWSPTQLSERVADIPTPGDPPAQAGPTRTLFVGQAGPASLYHRVVLPATALGADWCTARSEERRVGKECRSRRSAAAGKKTG